jgi:uncharacterized protein YecA (UPF0149 family)
MTSDQKTDKNGQKDIDQHEVDHVHGPGCSHHHHHHAQMPVVRLQPKVGRNDPCPCGSKQKFKKCCGK